MHIKTKWQMLLDMIVDSFVPQKSKKFRHALVYWCANGGCITSIASRGIKMEKIEISGDEAFRLAQCIDADYTVNNIGETMDKNRIGKIANAIREYGNEREKSLHDKKTCKENSEKFTRTNNHDVVESQRKDTTAFLIVTKN